MAKGSESKHIGQGSRASHGITNPKRRRVEQALKGVRLPIDPAKEILVGFSLRLYPSQIDQLEREAKRIGNITPSELARELIDISLDRWR